MPLFCWLPRISNVLDTRSKAAQNPARLMDRHTDELEYVLKALRHTRQDLVANPRIFEPGALERIDSAIAALEEEMQLKAA